MKCFLSVFAWGLTLAVAAGEPGAVRIDPTIPMFHKWQMESAGAVVDKAAAQGARRVEFCITLVSNLNAQFQPQNYGLLRETRDGGPGNTFYPSDDALRAELKGWCAAAFARAVEHHLEFAVLLHLNARGAIMHWRNDFDFDPLRPIGGTSYADALVGPVMEALEESLPPDWPVQVSLQGEMGRTVFAHPRSWLKLLEQLKRRGRLERALFGLSFNYQWVAGDVKPGNSSRRALQNLWETCDFIGVSMYQKLSTSPSSADVAANVRQFVDEFSALGCALPVRKPLDFVEFGIGGGGQWPDETFHTPARDAEAAARSPFVGTDNPDENPWKYPALVALRRQTYGAFCDFLAQPMSPHPVRAACTWSYGSWDVQGLVHPAFADQEIASRLQQHNRAARP